MSSALALRLSRPSVYLARPNPRPLVAGPLHGRSALPPARVAKPFSMESMELPDGFSDLEVEALLHEQPQPGADGQHCILVSYPHSMEDIESDQDEHWVCTPVQEEDKERQG